MTFAYRSALHISKMIRTVSRKEDIARKRFQSIESYDNGHSLAMTPETLLNNHPGWRNGSEQMQALIPANALASGPPETDERP